jgi:hypothetical protein
MSKGNIHGGSPKVVVGTWILNSKKINHRIIIWIFLWKNQTVLKNKRYQNMEIKQTKNFACCMDNICSPKIWDKKIIMKISKVIICEGKFKIQNSKKKKKKKLDLYKKQ